MHLANYLELLGRAQDQLAQALREVGKAHSDEADIFTQCQLQAEVCDRHSGQLRPFAERYAEKAPDEPESMHAELFQGPRSGGLGLLRDLHDLYVSAAHCDITWTLVGQAAQGVRDNELLEVVRRCEGETSTQLKWLRTRMKAAAPQALVVAV